MSDDTVDIPAGATQLVPAKPRVPVREARRRAKDLIAEASQLREGERQCTRMIRIKDEAGNPTGEKRRCRKSAIKGGFVCHTHGGGAPQVKKRAQRRLLAMVDPVITRLFELSMQDEHKPSALGAAKTILERAGNNPIGTLQTAAPVDTKPIIQIGIQVGGIAPRENNLPAPEVNLPTLAIEGEVDVVG